MQIYKASANAAIGFIHMHAIGDDVNTLASRPAMRLARLVTSGPGMIELFKGAGVRLGFVLPTAYQCRGCASDLVQAWASVGLRCVFRSRNPRHNNDTAILVFMWDGTDVAEPLVLPEPGTPNIGGGTASGSGSCALNTLSCAPTTYKNVPCTGVPMGTDIAPGFAFTRTHPSKLLLVEAVATTRDGTHVVVMPPMTPTWADDDSWNGKTLRSVKRATNANYAIYNTLPAPGQVEEGDSLFV